MEVSNKSSMWQAVVSPTVGRRGRRGRRWRRDKAAKVWEQIGGVLEERGVDCNYDAIKHKYHAVELVVGAVTRGCRNILVIGDSNTLHEVVNGLFIQKAVPPSEVLLSLVIIGNENGEGEENRCKDYSQLVDAMIERRSVMREIGVVSYCKSHYKQDRYMVDMTEVGFKAYLDRAYNRLRDKGRRRRWFYIWRAVKSIFRYKPTTVKLWLDDNLVMDGVVCSINIALTKSGESQDGAQFRVKATSRISRLNSLLHLGRLYRGDIYNHHCPTLSKYDADIIKIDASPYPTPVEIDGDVVGYSPLEIRIMRSAIRVVDTNR